jgi:GTP-binding protein EngB required for normal cell division
LGEKEGEGRALELLEQLARERGEARLAAEAREARTALASGRFNVAVVGQFKRGKSSLINALLGREVLPADVAPVTSVITIVEHGSSERATVFYKDARSEGVELAELARFVAEEANPGNREGVQAVTVELPAELLEHGVRLVDTPGVGSVFAANSEITRQFLPRIDVAIVVLGADPPISGDELALLQAIAPRAERLVYVLNKIDRVGEVTRRKAEAFARDVIARSLGADPGGMIHTSARKALQEGHDDGVAALHAAVQELATGSGARLARTSAARAARNLAAHLVRQLDLEEIALSTPLAELDKEMTAFTEAVRDIADLALAAITRTGSEPVVVWAEWQERKERFIDERLGAIARAVEEAVSGEGRAGRHSLRRCAVETSRERTGDSVRDWLSLVDGELARVRELRVSRVSEETNRLVDRVGAAAASAFGVPVARFEPQPVATDLGATACELVTPALALDVNDWLVPALDAVSPRRVVAGRAVRRARALAAEWLRSNLGWIDERVVEAIDALTRRLEGAMRERLIAVQHEVVGAIAAGRRRKVEGEAAVAERLGELRRCRTRVSAALSLLPAAGGASSASAVPPATRPRP